MDEQMLKPKKRGNKTPFFTGFFAGMAAISVLGFLILLIVVFSQGKPVDLAAVQAGDDAQPTPTDQPTAPAVDVPAIKDGEAIKGNKDAQVEIIEYSDLECPFCLKHKLNMDQVYSEYKDKVKIVFRHFPLSFHENAFKAAVAVECAGEQGKFWQMFDLVFDANEAENMSVDAWKSAAKDMGLDQDKFDKCLDSDKYADKINNDMLEGGAAGVQGTPATFINGELISGAVPVEVIKEAIETVLAQ